MKVLSSLSPRREHRNEFLKNLDHEKTSVFESNPKKSSTVLIHKRTQKSKSATWKIKNRGFLTTKGAEKEKSKIFGF
jgi:hypothetical protein